MTIRQWLRNFWYYHKFFVIGGAVILVLVSFWIWSIAAPPNYDLKTALWCSEKENRLDAGMLTDYLKKYPNTIWDTSFLYTLTDSSLEEYINNFGKGAGNAGGGNVLVKDISPSAGASEWDRNAVFRDPQHTVVFADKETIEALKAGDLSLGEKGPLTSLSDGFVELEERYPGKSFIDGVAYSLKDSGLYRRVKEKDEAAAEKIAELYLLLRVPDSEKPEDRLMYRNAENAVGLIITEIYGGSTTSESY